MRSQQDAGTVGHQRLMLCHDHSGRVRLEQLLRGSYRLSSSTTQDNNYTGDRQRDHTGRLNEIRNAMPSCKQCQMTRNVALELSDNALRGSHRMLYEQE
jgi:hypothetical protein